MAAKQARLHFNPNTPPSSLMLCFTKDEILEHLTVRLKNVLKSFENSIYHCVSLYTRL